MERVSEKYRVMLSKAAAKDLEQLVKEGYGDKIATMLERMEADPFYLSCERPTLNLEGKYSRRINIKDRLVFEIKDADDGCKGIVHVIRMKGHYRGIYSILAL